MTDTTAPVTTDTTIIKALRRIRMPQTQRNRELGLLLFAFLINASAVALVQLGATGHIDWTFLYYCGGLTVLVLGMHIVLRYRAPQADPFVVPIATVLSGLGLGLPGPKETERRPLLRGQPSLVAVDRVARLDLVVIAHCCISSSGRGR